MKTGLLRIALLAPQRPLQPCLAHRPQEFSAHIPFPLFREDLQNFPLTPSELLRHDYPRPHHQVPRLTIPPRPRGPGAPYLKPLALLRPRWQPQLHRPSTGPGHLDLRPERRLDEADGYAHQKVAPTPLEDRVLGSPRPHVQAPRRPTISPGAPPPGDPDLHPILPPRRYLHRYLPVLPQPS